MTVYQHEGIGAKLELENAKVESIRKLYKYKKGSRKSRGGVARWLNFEL
jgi:hypothetical protein